MKRALLVIDVQNEYFTGMLPITHPVGHLGKILEVMDASAGRVPTVVIQHRMLEEDKPFFQKGKPGWELHPEVEGRPRDLRVEKTLPGSFTGTGLESWLREQGIDTVTIAGYMTHMCCDTTARQAVHRGFAVEFLSDATGTLPLTNSAGSVTAEELHRSISLCPANDAQRGPSRLGLDRPNPSQHHESLRLPLDASIREPEILPLVAWRPRRISRITTSPQSKSKFLRGKTTSDISGPGSRTSASCPRSIDLA